MGFICLWRTYALKYFWRTGKYMHICMFSVTQSSLCSPMDCSPPGSSVHGILQARILEWVAMPSSRRSFQPRDWTCVSCGSCISGRFFTTEPLGKSLYVLTCTICSWWTLCEISVCPSFIWSFVLKIYVTVSSTSDRWDTSQNFLRVPLLGYNP